MQEKKKDKQTDPKPTQTAGTQGSSNGGDGGTPPKGGDAMTIAG